MKYTLCLFAAAVMVSGICTGCRKADTATPASIKKPETTDKEWAPETAQPAHDPNDGGDHSGHNH
jgi:hypothetical protein